MDAGILGEPMYEEVRYAKPFLKQVVARIDFLVPLEGVQDTLTPKLAKILSELFPIVEPTDAVEHQVQLQIGSDPVHTKKTFKQWNFFGIEREKQLSLTRSFVVLSKNIYTTYEDLKGDYAAVVGALETFFPEARVGRFGLRYINNIEIEGLDPVAGWNEYVTPAFLGTFSFFESRQLTRLVQIAELKCGELDLKFQFGIPNPDYPAPIKRPMFVLDLDAYIRTAHEFSASVLHIDQAHRCIQELFEQSITDRLREQMNVKPSPPVR